MTLRKPLIVNYILDQILAVEELTNDEKNYFEEIKDQAKALLLKTKISSDYTTGTEIVDYLSESLNSSNLDVASKRKLKNHIELLELLSQLVRELPETSSNLPTQASDYIQQKNGGTAEISSLGQDEQLPIFIECLPDNVEKLQNIVNKLSYGLDTSIYPGICQNALTTICTSCLYRANANTATQQKTDKEKKEEKTAKEYALFIAEHEGALIALLNLQVTNETFLYKNPNLLSKPADIAQAIKLVMTKPTSTPEETLQTIRRILTANADTFQNTDDVQAKNFYKKMMSAAFSEKCKLKAFDDLFNKMEQAESLTNGEIEFFEKLVSQSITGTSLTSASPDLIEEQLNQSTKISSESKQKIKTHLQVIEAILQICGTMDSPGIFGLAFSGTGVNAVGANELSPFLELALPENEPRLHTLKTILERFTEEHSSLYENNQEVLSNIFQLQGAITSKLKNPPTEEKKSKEALEFAKAHENELMAIAKIRRTNAELTSILNAKMQTECKIQVKTIDNRQKSLIDYYYNPEKVLIIATDTEKSTVISTNVEIEGKQSDRPVLEIVPLEKQLGRIAAEMLLDYQNKKEPVTGILNQNKDLLSTLQQQLVVRQVAYELDHGNAKEPRKILQSINNVVVNSENRKPFEKTEKESFVRKLFKQILSTVSFGLANKLWITKATPKHDSYIDKVALFSKPATVEPAKSENTSSAKDENKRPYHRS